MHPDRFDAMTKAFAGNGSRRQLLHRAGAAFGAGLVALGFGRSPHPGRALGLEEEPDLEERSVRLFEDLAAVAHAHRTSCDDLAATTRRFGLDHQDLLAQIRANEATWSDAHRYQHAVTYADRRQRAIDLLQDALRSCSGTVTPVTPVSERSLLPVPQGPAVMALSVDPGREAPSLTVSAEGCAQNVWPPEPLVMCHLIGGDWYSPRFYWPITCPDGHISHDCGFCPEGDLNGDVFCNQHWPDQCPPDRPCGLALHVGCCEENCPVSTGDCALNWITGTGSGTACDTCMTGWCGSYDRCIEDCDSSDCCNTACSSSNVPDPPPAGQVQVGTPSPSPATPPPSSPPAATPVVISS